MKKYLLVSTVLMSFAVMKAQTTKWTLDKTHASINFEVAHMVISEVTGNFKNFDVNATADKNDFTDAKFDVTIQVKSINTNEENRDKHLIGVDFFDADKYPNIEFKGMQLKMVGDKKYKAIGNLTIKGVTKPVTFDVTFGGTYISPYTKKPIAAFKFSGNITREDFGVTYNSALETGGVAIGKEVKISGSFELIKN